MEQTVYLQTKNLCVGYSNTPVVSQVELQVNRGEILTLIGPNGSGKTTILKTIINQLKPLNGVVCIESENVAQMDAHLLAQKMSVVLTNRLHTEMMTVREVVETGRYPYTGRFGILSEKDHHIVEEAMELVRVKTIEGRDFSKISDGQRQRVMLARALAQEPEVIVLDEPTSFLDIKYKLEFLSMLKNLAKTRNMTVIMSLHEVELARIVSDRIACIKNGVMERIGTPQDIFANQYVLKLFDIEEAELSPEFYGMAVACLTEP